ncbi:MAG: nucleoside hydrolase [Chloroflexi bacterium]|nr:MAG: nucleoside hydrolase [Chloroflexota bacterium]MBL1194705.1 nucleoside hydrolase [Chloroflexota bacterium]NOH11998.1 nucleoside hydrolase [Chloroflexota bacterium]
MKRLVIDTDPGVDDAEAIMMASVHPDASIEALTVVGGNVPLENTVPNTLKILDVLGEEAPVFAGSPGPLVSLPDEDAAFVHGSDGLGDAGLPASTRKVEEEHAANALVRLANENPGELSLIAIGPLTNVALATRLDPELPQKYKELIIMGGAVYAQGNTVNTTAEFNIFFDPEAAYVVFDAWPELTMISWEATMSHAIGPDQLKLLKNNDNPRGIFFDAISAKIIKFIKEVMGRDELFGADPLAMAVALEPDIVTKMAKHHVHVERFGGASRGQTIVDWNNRTGKEPNANIVLDVDMERFFDLFHAAVR